MILFTREFYISNSADQYILTFAKMQEENWGDIEKVFQNVDEKGYYMNSHFQY